MEQHLIYILLACSIGFLLTWSVGANDLANIMSTTMGSKAVSVRQALLIAVIFEFAGALLGGNEVSHTIRYGIINLDVLNTEPEIFIDGMLAVLMAGSTWMLLASYFGLPVSITNAIVGGLVGLGSVVLGIHAIAWGKVGWIAVSWFSSPLLAGLVGYGLFRSIQHLIFEAPDPLHKTCQYLPFYLFVVGIVLAYMTVLKGFEHFDIHLSFLQRVGITIIIAALVTLIGLLISKRFKLNNISLLDRFAPVEKIFGLLMALTACAMVFAHGSNDVAIAVGPVAAVIDVSQMLSQKVQSGTWSTWFIPMGCLSVVIGLMMYGRKVIATVGSGITALTPSRAFSATLAAAVTVIVSTSTGIPVSATQTLVGAVLGVGLARGIGALNISVIRNILLSWLVTIPVTSALACGYFYLLKIAFN